MKIFKRLASGTSVAVLTLSSLMTFGFTGVAHALASTCTWTGTAGDNKFSTATNWSGCNSVAPQAGDILSFGALTPPANSNASTVTLTNDLTVALGGVISTNSGGFNTTYHIDTLTLADNPLLQNNQSTTPSTYINISTVIVQGNITLSSNMPYSAATWNVTGAITVGSANIYQRFTPTDRYGSLVIQMGAKVTLDPGTNTAPALSVPITFGGGSGSTTPEVALDSICGYVPGQMDCTYTPATWAVTSPVTLLSNAYFGPLNSSTINYTGAISGSGFSLTVDPSATGKLNLNPSSNTSATQGGTAKAVAVTNTLSDSQPTASLEVGNNTTDILDGTRGQVYVIQGGTLKGTGTASSLFVSAGGIVAPGHSPGTLTVVNLLQLSGGSTYQAELKTATPGGFDQIVVGSAADTTGNDVTLGDTTGSPTLAATLYPGYSIKAGDQFMIINNLSKTPVKGTFNGLPEGATFKVGNGVFKISYVGGDGNDVVLTAITAPTAPNTGFALMSAHPGLTLGVTVLVAGFIVALARANSRKLAPSRVKATRRRR